MNYEKQLPRKYRKACAFERTRAICVSLVERLRENRGKGAKGVEGLGSCRGLNEIDRGDKFCTIENRATTNSQV